MASTKINCRNETDATVEFTVTWAASLVGQSTVQPDGMGSVGTEFVWYDVWVKSSADGMPLASKPGVYGNSTVVLLKRGDVHILI
jgi:hypothetical protein